MNDLAPILPDAEPAPPKARILREALGLSLRTLAHDLGIDFGQLSKVENGKRGWSLQFAFAWLDYMTVQVEKARADGFLIPDSSIPTLRELAAIRPESRIGEPKRKRRKKTSRHSAGAKGGKKHARGKVPRGSTV